MFKRQAAQKGTRLPTYDLMDEQVILNAVLCSSWKIRSGRKSQF